mgnify:CR=1 FL=1
MRSRCARPARSFPITPMNSRRAVTWLASRGGLAAAISLAIVVLGAPAHAETSVRSAASLNRSAPLRQTTWAWRDVIHDTLHEPTPEVMTVTRPPELSPLLLHEVPATDVVALPAFRVTSERIYSGLHETFARDEKRAREAYVARRLGIGTQGVH